MKILLDMNMSPQWVNALISRGIPATHWSSVGAFMLLIWKLQNLRKIMILLF